MEVYKTTSVQDSQTYVDNCLGDHQGSVIHSSNHICILTGQLPTYNKEVVAEYGFEVGVGKYFGGTIVCFPHDVSVCITSQTNPELAFNIVQASTYLFAHKGLKVKIVGNDVLVDDKKVVSWACIKCGGWYQSVIHYSIGVMDIDLVKEICTKPMAKTPGSLGEYGITTEEISGLVESILRSN